MKLVVNKINDLKLLKILFRNFIRMHKPMIIKT